MLENECQFTRAPPRLPNPSTSVYFWSRKQLCVTTTCMSRQLMSIECFIQLDGEPTATVKPKRLRNTNTSTHPRRPLPKRAARHFWHR